MLVLLLIILRFTFSSAGLKAYIRYILSNEKSTKLTFVDFLNSSIQSVKAYRYLWLLYIIEPWVFCILVQLYTTGHINLTAPELPDFSKLIQRIREVFIDGLEKPSAVVEVIKPQQAVQEAETEKSPEGLVGGQPADQDQDKNTAVSQPVEICTDPIGGIEAWRYQGSTYDDSRLFAAEPQSADTLPDQHKPSSGEHSSAPSKKPEGADDSKSSSAHSSAPSKKPEGVDVTEKGKPHAGHAAPEKTDVDHYTETVKLRDTRYACNLAHSITEDNAKHTSITAGAEESKTAATYNTPAQDQTARLGGDYLVRPIERHVRETSFEWGGADPAKDIQVEINAAEAAHPNRKPYQMRGIVNAEKDVQHTQYTKGLALWSDELKASGANSNIATQLKADYDQARDNYRLGKIGTPEVDAAHAKWQDKARENIVLDKILFTPKDDSDYALWAKITISDDIAHREHTLVKTVPSEPIRQTHDSMYNDSVTAMSKRISSDPSSFRPTDQKFGITDPKMTPAEIEENNRQVIAHAQGHAERAAKALSDAKRGR